MKKITLGATVATMVAGLILSGNVMAEDTPAPAPAKVKCMGTNSCHATGSCKSVHNECKGKNSCKGKGWIEVESEKVCTDKGGTVMK